MEMNLGPAELDAAARAADFLDAGHYAFDQVVDHATVMRKKIAASSVLFFGFLM